ncbi:CaiB/BaiF CoA transferase family protein [Seonamhaeicola aphaedonensis]|uniref:Crotonobetainyl-CoA:carnitine CoA-transferase CaiB-like acyl-CoA transferase n=1 Tax=Seonamhaeicola aphaedonensis TaxID=1461338 RepID=A0A3D9HDB6_9FLAO|nr:CoA transferase [Seonamhaeicola aphaedonensis]RED47453.1 crotonobetainyl-CoA:carnitine CoA-transferase CaiB-like acyl-CoA transferase [Seonamhaeicola aphaedonensis]
MEQHGPLKGLVVADFSQLAQGPWATQMLGDMGADIIKIEPVKGDWMRHYSYGNLYPEGESISFISFNRNKKSIALDLKSDEGKKIAKDIIAKADILLENFRPGVMERLGLGYEDMKTLNPGLVYCSSSGYGASGPYLKRPGQDLLAQSISGAPYLNGQKGGLPVVTAVGQADLLTSLFIVQSVLAGIYSRSVTGKGQKIEANLLSSALGFHIQEITAFLLKGENPERSASGIPNPWLGAPYGLYNTSDGYIAIGMNSVQRLAQVIGLDKYDSEAYKSNNIIDNRDNIRNEFNAVFKTKTTSEWLKLLLAEDIWCSQVNSFKEMVEDPQIKHNDMILEYEHPKVGTIKTTGFPVKFSDTPQKIEKPAPLLNQHAEEILKQYCGYSDKEVQSFLNKT